MLSQQLFASVLRSSPAPVQFNLGPQALFGGPVLQTPRRLACAPPMTWSSPGFVTVLWGKPSDGQDLQRQQEGPCVSVCGPSCPRDLSALWSLTVPHSVLEMF